MYPCIYMHGVVLLRNCLRPCGVRCFETVMHRDEIGVECASCGRFGKENVENVGVMLASLCISFSIIDIFVDMFDFTLAFVRIVASQLLHCSAHGRLT